MLRKLALPRHAPTAGQAQIAASEPAASPPRRAPLPPNRAPGQIAANVMSACAANPWVLLTGIILVSSLWSVVRMVDCYTMSGLSLASHKCTCSIDLAISHGGSCCEQVEFMIGRPYLFVIPFIIPAHLRKPAAAIFFFMLTSGLLV
eukprot:COSAG05_NODE_1421_length_4927_cov_3.941384_4_plen_147_part_00